MSDGMLSQEEIDALLKGDDILSDDSNEIEEIESEENDEMEIDSKKSENDNREETSNKDYSNVLTAIEIDALGEVGNISMGTAATTLATLINKKVNITTPTVEVTTADILAQEYEAPLVAVDVSYSEGLKGSNIMLLKTDDVKVITDLMMGKEEIDKDRELTEIDLSAVSEAMNQMMGSSATSLSSMLGKQIDIQPPIAEKIIFSEGKKKIDLLKDDGPLIKISFRMEIGSYVDSNIMQLIPVRFGKEMIETLMGGVKDNEEELEIEEPVIETIKKEVEVNEPEIQVNKSKLETEEIKEQNQSKQSINSDTVLVSKPEFPTFDNQELVNNESEIDLVGDIPVEITVELGRTNKNIGEILEFGVGTILELDKLVGEPLKIFANGKYIACGEVVVIDDSFGVRITEIEKSKKII